MLDHVIALSETIKQASALLQIFFNQYNNYCLHKKRSMASQMLEEVKCPICFDTLKKPIRILGCGHNLCQECLEELIDSFQPNRCGFVHAKTSFLIFGNITFFKRPKNKFAFKSIVLIYGWLFSTPLHQF